MTAAEVLRAIRGAANRGLQAPTAFDTAGQSNWQRNALTRIAQLADHAQTHDAVSE